jgi:mannose-1-phosphate guanylyltransferase
VTGQRKIVPVILSGGMGTRLWPLSRALHPKQLQALTSEFSLLQETAIRLNDAQFEAPMIICNQEHRFTVAQHLQNINIAPQSIVLEATGRNTAPAAAALLALSQTVLKPDMAISEKPEKWITLMDASTSKPSPRNLI